MAKKTTATKATKGGKGAALTRKAMRDDVSVAQGARAAIAAMKRAISQLEGRLDDDAPTLAAGSYPVAIEVSIAGDVTVAAPRTIAAKEETSFKDGELLAAIFAGESEERLHSVIADAVRRLADAPKDGDLRVKIDGARSLIDTLAFKAATAKRLIKRTLERSTAGAVSGAPHVEVTGTIGVNGADVELVMDV
jgi:hypothetical protein